MGVEWAQNDTVQMTCNQARSAVKSPGGTVLRSGANRYDLYHRADGSCSKLEEVAHPAFVSTRDNATCFIGYTCADRETDSN